MQTTESLIKQFSRTRRDRLLAPRIHKQIRKRARRGDALARDFLNTLASDHFKPGEPDQVADQVDAWLGRQGELNGP